MRNLATLLVVGLLKYHQSISRSKVWGSAIFDVSDVFFMEINRKKLNIWQPCNEETGNPLDRKASKISPNAFSEQKT